MLAVAVFMMNQIASKRRCAKTQAVKPVKIEKRSVTECCRTCLSREDLVSIFYSKENEAIKSEELRLVTGLEIKMDDGLSQKMCTKCVDIVNTTLQFRRTSKKAEKTLRNMLNGTLLKRKTIKPRRCKIKTDRFTEDFEDGDLEREDCNKPEIEQDPVEDYTEFNNRYEDDFQNLDCEIKVEEVKPKVKSKPGPKKRGTVIPNASSYKCTTCNKEFRMKATYKAHMRFHTNYCVCESCGKRCRNNNQLQEHKRARHGLGKIHKCAYCEYSSATKEALVIHERRHTGERPYICDHCGTTFHRRSNLVQHIAIHLPEKNFQCDMCPKKLKSRKFLQIHKHNAHTGKRYGYLCPVCKHRFEKPNKVRAHTRRVHGLPDLHHPPIVRCPHCPKREKSRKLLTIHEYKVHRKNRYRYMCPVCSDTFTRPGNVRQHLSRSHSIARDHQGPIKRIQVTSPN